MNTKKIFGYVGLGLVAALIIVVVILSFVTVKLSPTFAEPTAQISVYKCDTGVKYKYNMITDNLSADSELRADYNSVLDAFNNLGSYTVMQSLFLGLTNVNTSITTFKTTDDFKGTAGGYLIELNWSTAQTLKNIDGSTFLDGSGDAVTYKTIRIFVDNTNEITEYKVYVCSLMTSTISDYYFTSYSNVQTLYDIASNFDDENKLNAYTS